MASTVNVPPTRRMILSIATGVAIAAGTASAQTNQPVNVAAIYTVPVGQQ